jgi:hypothetical protein
MFPAWHILLTAVVTGVLTAAITVAADVGWRGRTHLRRLSIARGDVVGVGVAAALSVLLWRLGANVPTLNDDPIPGISPADVLSAALAYVAVSSYGRLRAVGTPENAERLVAAPAVAAVVALIVNVITI